DQCRATTTVSFPLPPEGDSQSQTDPPSEIDQHLWGFAEAEVASPASHIGSQFRDRRLDADPLGLSCDFPDSSLESVQGLRCHDALDLGTGGEAESEKLSLLRLCHCTLRLIY